MPVRRSTPADIAFAAFKEKSPVGGERKRKEKVRGKKKREGEGRIGNVRT